MGLLGKGFEGRRRLRVQFADPLMKYGAMFGKKMAMECPLSCFSLQSQRREEGGTGQEGLASKSPSISGLVRGRGVTDHSILLPRAAIMRGRGDDSPHI